MFSNGNDDCIFIYKIVAGEIIWVILEPNFEPRWRIHKQYGKFGETYKNRKEKRRRWLCKIGRITAGVCCENDKFGSLNMGSCDVVSDNLQHTVDTHDVIERKKTGLLCRLRSVTAEAAW